MHLVACARGSPSPSSPSHSPSLSTPCETKHADPPGQLNGNISITGLLSLSLFSSYRMAGFYSSIGTLSILPAGHVTQGKFSMKLVIDTFIHICIPIVSRLLCHPSTQDRRQWYSFYGQRCFLHHVGMFWVYNHCPSDPPHFLDFLFLHHHLHQSLATTTAANLQLLLFYCAEVSIQLLLVMLNFGKLVKILKFLEVC